MIRVYLAHQLSAKLPNGQIDHPGILKNIESAKLWYKWASDHYRDYCFAAMWIINCEVYEDTPENRAIGMQRNYEYIKSSNQLWMTGPSVSPGMTDEGSWAWRCHLPVYNLTSELDPRLTPRIAPQNFPLWRPGSLTEQALTP
jgi:hypothetical protein